MPVRQQCTYNITLTYVKIIKIINAPASKHLEKEKILGVYKAVNPVSKSKFRPDGGH